MVLQGKKEFTGEQHLGGREQTLEEFHRRYDEELKAARMPDQIECLAEEPGQAAPVPAAFVGVAITSSIVRPP